MGAENNSVHSSADAAEAVRLAAQLLDLAADALDRDRARTAKDLASGAYALAREIRQGQSEVSAELERLGRETGFSITERNGRIEARDPITGVLRASELIYGPEGAWRALDAVRAALLPSPNSAETNETNRVYDGPKDPFSGTRS